VNSRKLAPANVVILVAGVLMLIGSFLAFYKSETNGVSVAEVNAWDHGLFMIATLPALLGTVMALQIVLVAFGNITMPNRVLSLTWDQFHLVTALQTLVLMVGFLVRARVDEVVFETHIEVIFGAGFWLMLVGAVGLVLGAFMRLAPSRRRPRAI
jgi:disulfide bond formation protein DsbB